MGNSLHHLQGLSRLEISCRSGVEVLGEDALGDEVLEDIVSEDDVLGDILQYVQQLSALASLRLTATSASNQDPAFRNLKGLSHLRSLQHLTHLALGCRPAPKAPLVLGGPVAARLAQDLPRLVRLELSCLKVRRGAAEALVMLQHLTQLSVWGMRPLGPMDEGPPCSWKELTLCGEQHWLYHLKELPLGSLERICMGSGVLHLLLPNEDGAEMAEYIDDIRGFAALLASKLRGAGGGFGDKEEDGLLSPLIGIVYALVLELHQMQDSHVRELAEALPQLRRLAVRTEDISDGAWACLGAVLPSLGALILRGDKKSFRPEYIAHLASSLSHPLVVAIQGGGVAAALAGLRALLAVPHAGAGFITLKEPSPAGDSGPAWRDVFVPNVMLDWWSAKK